MTITRSIRLCSTIALAATGAASVQAQDKPAEEKPKPKWESSLAAGMTLTRGNSETLLANVKATTQKKWERDEISLGADGTYGESEVDGENTVNASSVQGFVQYNHLFSERCYAYARIDALNDDIADIYYRVTLSPGVGYYFIKNKTTDLSAEIGPSYIFENLGGDKRDYMTLRVAEKFNHQISDRARLHQSVEWLPAVEDFEDYIVNFTIGIEADLTKDKKTSLRVDFLDTYDSVPAPDREKNDMKLVASIAYKF